MGDSDRNRNLGLILIFLAIGIAAYLWKESKSQSEVKKTTRITANVNDEANRERLEKSINSHIQMTNTQMEVAKEQIKVEASFTIPRVGEFVVEKHTQDGSFSQRGDRNEMNVARDLRRHNAPSVSASDIIQAELSNDQNQARVDKVYQEEYARQFIENARRNGYEIKLSEDFRVIGVRRIRGTSSYQGNGESFR